MKERICENCGKTYPQTRDWQRYCSTRCRKDSWKANKLGARQLADHERRIRDLEIAIGLLFSKLHQGGAAQEKNIGLALVGEQAPACSGQGSFGLQDRPEKKVNLNIGK